jgi:hypothetical protein
MSDIKEKKHTGLVKNYTLELSDIEGRINNIGKNIKF